MKTSKMIGFAALASAASLLGATAAEAHAKLVSASPSANATVAAPKQVILKFNEKLSRKFSGADISMPAMPGMAMAAKLSIGKDGKTLILQPKTRLMAGAYTVKWRVVTPDTHRTEGTYAFTVR